MIVFVVVLGSMIFALASCGVAVKGNSSGLPWSAPGADSGLGESGTGESGEDGSGTGAMLFGTDSFFKKPPSLTIHHMSDLKASGTLCINSNSSSISPIAFFSLDFKVLSL